MGASRPQGKVKREKRKMMHSKKLSQFKEIVHGFTTKKDGDFRSLALTHVSGTWRGILQKLILAEQVHGEKIYGVEEQKKRRVIKGVDGLVSKDKGIIVGVRTADCLPILFYEPKARIIAAVHAGWRGTLLGISQKMIRKIESLDGKAQKIMASFGPHIGRCCYEIDEERASLFEKEFGKNSLIVSFFEGKSHLDIGYANFLQLLQAGLSRENIEALPSCTFCNRDFFSYRRSKKEGEKYGEMLSFLGLVR